MAGCPRAQGACSATRPGTTDQKVLPPKEPHPIEIMQWRRQASPVRLAEHPEGSYCALVSKKLIEAGGRDDRSGGQFRCPVSIAGSGR
jgi:hypothetical protein